MMTFDCATLIVVTRMKLLSLRNKATNDADISAIDSKLARLRPYAKDANDVVIAHSDAEFSAAAKQLNAQTKKLDAANADIKKLSAALTEAGELISKIIQLLGPLAVFG
jgi:DNA repair exonuclease SbcCD ATPase subunit